MLQFSKTEVDAFKHSNPSQRWGQAFFDHFHLDKVTQDKDFCNKIYNADDETAKIMVTSRIDHSQ